MFNNLDQVLATIDKWEADVLEMVEGVARGLSVEMFNGVLQWSAQYSGDFAANWKYSVGTPDYTFTPNLLKPVVGPGRSINIAGGDQGEMLKVSVSNSGRLLGDFEAIRLAKRLNSGRSQEFRLGVMAYVSNSAQHSDPYAMRIEEGKIKFRDGNVGAPGKRTLDGMRSKYEVITAEKAQYLMKQEIR